MLDSKCSALEEKQFQKLMKKLPYIEALDEETKKSDDFIAFIFKLFSIFEMMEAGGIHLTDVGASQSKIQFQIFREFIRSLEIWGSYQPLKNIYSHNIKEMSYHHAQTQTKIKDFVRKVDSFIQNQRAKPLTVVETSILEDLEVVSSIFPVLYQKLYLLHNKNSSASDTPKTVGSKENLEEIQLISYRKNDVDGETDKVQGLSTLSNLGHLIPVTCGHNGSLNKAEKSLFDYHLKNSGFLLSPPPRF